MIRAYDKETFYDHTIAYPRIFSLPDLHPPVLRSRRKRRRLPGGLGSGTDGIYTGVEEKTLSVKYKLRMFLLNEEISVADICLLFQNIYVLFLLLVLSAFHTTRH